MSPPLHQPDHGSIAYELAALRSELKTNTDETKKVVHLLTGNGTPEKGIVVRLDRIEQREATRSKLSWAAVGIALSSLGAWVRTHW